MSELKNCCRCGRIFSAQSGTVCRKCLESENDEYMIVRKYVRNHPGNTVFDVAKATGIEEEKVLKFLRDGKLESVGITPVLECERCGRYITVGKYCGTCISELNSQINKIIPARSEFASSKAEIKKSKDRMYTKDE